MSENIVAIHQPNFMPWPLFWHKFFSCTDFVFLNDAVYSHGGYVNRCKVGEDWLTVPIQKSGRLGQLISEVKLVEDTRWRKKHVGRIKSRYNRYLDTPLFTSILSIYETPGTHLVSFNVRILNVLAKEFGKPIPRIHQDWSFFGLDDATGTDRILGMCRQLQADVYLSGASGPKYMELWKFDRDGVEFRLQQKGDIPEMPCTLDLLALYNDPFSFLMEDVASVTRP